MKPMQLHFPDDLRDQMDACLDAHPTSPAMAVADLLFSTDPVHPHRPFIQQLADALTGMQVGASTPVVQLDNLPPRHGEVFTEALLSILGGDMNQKVPALKLNKGIAENILHQDTPYYPNVGRKMIRCLHVRDPGANPDPTIFINADEVLQALACAQVGLPFDSTMAHIAASPQCDAYQKAREELITAYRAKKVYVSSLMDDSLAESQPFLQRNPQGGEGAPDFFICATRYNECNYTDAPELAQRFYAMAERLRGRATEQSTASTRAHSAVFWNDMAVLHDRAGPMRPERELLSSCARPHSFTQRLDPTQRFAGAPICPVR